MARSVARLTDRSTPSGDAADIPIEPIDIGPDERLAGIVEQVDIGARHLTSTTHGFDILEDDARRVLASIARHAGGRGLAAYVHVPGECIQLTSTSVDAAVTAIASRPRFRVIARSENATVENIGIELWTESARAMRPKSGGPAVQLLLPGRVPADATAHRTDADVDMPIDAVYTWVDANDPGWRELAAEHMDLADIDLDRYGQIDELRYSLRSLETFAPWIGRIHILSNCAPPDWFVASDRVRWVDHAEVMNDDQRPQFNSGAIDTYLHRIPDLTEHFIYLNDDFLLWDSATPATFFTWDGRSIARLSPNSSTLYLEQVVAGGEAKPSQWSRVNAARLLEERIGVYPTRLHGHSPYALRRSLLAEIEQEFADEMAATRASRLRRETDVSFVAFIYHHLMEARGKAVLRDEDGAFVTQKNYQRQRLRQSLTSAPFVCLQESRGSSADAAFRTYKRGLLERALPLPSAAEHPTVAD